MNIAKINKIGVTLSLLVLIGSGFFVPLSQINSAFAANLGTIQITVNPANSAPIDNELNAMIVAVLDGDTYLNDPGEYIPDENFTGAQGRTFTITNVPLNGTNTYTIAVAFFKEQQKSVDYSLYTVTSGGATLAPGTQSGSFMANVAGTRSGNTVSYAINIARSNPTISLTTTPPSPTNQSSVTVAGITRKNSTVTVTGGAVTANTTANSSGVFSLNVTLNQNAANALQVKATDTAGAESNIVSASVRHDNTPPVITLSGANPETVEAGSAYVELGATATDSLEGNLTGRISINTSAVNTNALGSYTVRYNVSDTSGNVATEVTRTVNVVDTVIPVITLTGANPQTVEVGSAYTELGATALDNYNGNITANIIVNAGAVNTSALGSYAVTYNISDSSSNVATEKTRTVNVIDTTKPIITLAGANPQTIQVGSPYTELGATASDNYNGNISANIVVNSSGVNVNTVGTYTLTYNVSDSSGNTATQKTRTVSVVDTVKPVITPIGADTVGAEAGLPYTDAGATATDNYDGNITARIVIANPVDTSTLGTYTIRYNVADASGNIALEKTRTVRVTDTISPTITRNGSATITVEYSSTYVDAGATATDSFAGNLTANIVTTNSVNTGALGSYTVRYNVSDPSSNVATEVTRTVSVVDTTKPVITRNGSATVMIEYGSVYTDAGATATDNVGGNITANIVVTNPVNTSALGTYTVRYNITDSSGNIATEVTRAVNVADTTKPVITRLGASPINAEAGTSYTDAGATATDNVNGNITANIAVTNPVNINSLGSYTVRYNVSDTAGNAATEVTRVVNVADTTKPVITRNGSATISVEKGTTYTDAGATASDSFAGNLTSNIVVTNPVNVNVVGSYVILYNVSDPSGNAAVEVIRTVNVEDTTPPSAPVVNTPTSPVNANSVPITGTAEAGGIVTITGGAATATGVATGGNFSISVNLTQNATNALSITAKDASNNTSAATTATIVEDSVNPTITIIGENPASIEFGTTYTDAGATITDNIGTSEPTSVTSNVNTNALGTYTVEYSATDMAGNSASATRVVNVVDTTAPVISLIGSSTVTTEAGLPYVDAGATATDNVDGNISANIIAVSTVNTSELGTYVVTYGVSDSSDNPALEVARTVLVRDTITPIITLVGNSTVTTEFGLPYVDAGATAFDSFRGNLTADITTSSNVNVNSLGTYTVTYGVSDISGNAATEIVRTVNVQDTIAPNAPIFTTASTTINANSITVTGTAEADSTITITGGAETATGVAAGGSFSILVDLAQDAVSTLQVTATDASSNVSLSSSLVIVEDSTNPIITGVSDGDIKKTVTFFFNEGEATLDGNSMPSATTVNTEGVYVLIVIDNAGNETTVNFEIDRTAPSVPSITTPGQTVNADFIAIEGTAEAESTITITGGLATATGTATGGNFSILVNLTQDATNTLSVTAKDTVNNESSAATILITEDSTAPSAPTITTSPQAINAASLLIVGTAEANASIGITGGAATATGGANGLGNYLISVLLTEDATNTLSITATDTAGNVSSSSVIVIVEDSTAPAAPIIITLPQTINAGSITVEGTAEANATINITGGTSPVTGTVDENSNFAIEVSLTQNATNNLSVTATDALENESLPYVIVIVEDSTPPTAPAITTESQTINANSITVEGIAEADSTITITGGFATATGTATGGSFSISVNLTQNATNTLSVTATDAYGNVSLSASLVVVEDSTSPNAPNISTPNQTVNAATKTVNGTAEAGTLIKATGGFETATSTVTVGGNFSIVVKLRQNEANVLSLTATDAAGNESAADTVTITEDSIAPTAPTVTTLPQTIDADSIVIEGTAEPEAYILIAIYGGAETVSDRAEIDGSFAIDIPLTQDALNHLLVTAADAVNNTSPTTSVDITEDGTPPVITLIGDNPQSIEVGSAYAELGATAEDSLEGDLTEDIVIDANAVVASTLGSYMVTYDVSDSTGNAVQVTRTVNVVDITPPVIVPIGEDQTIEVGSAYTELGATASDNYDGDITANIVINASAVDIDTLGSYTITYNIVDSSENAATEVIRTVNVVDATLPVITLIGDNPQTVEAGTSYMEQGATASDNYDGDITANITTDASSVDVNTIGSYAVTYNVSDSSGNAATEITRTVNVTDTIAPVIILVGNDPQIIEVGDTYTELGATASDSFEGDITGGITIDATAVNTSVLGNYIVTYSISDVSGNAAIQVTRSVDILDTTVPVITLTGDNSQTIEVGSAYTELGATASDNYDGNITGSIIIDTSTVIENTLGEYIVTYNVSDSSGNGAAEVTRTVNVVDTAIPVITLTGDNPQIIEVGSIYAELGATASDNYDGDITENIVINTSAVDTNTLGSYTVTYNVSDSSENIATEVTRTVNVVDTTVPVITLIGNNPQTIEVHATYAELGATASDNYYGDISADIVIDTSTIDMDTLGSYTVTYNVSDASGNDAVEVTRTVNIVDTTIPVIALTGNNPQTVEVGFAYTELGATASDNYYGDISADIVIDTSVVDINTLGSYNVTYNVTDASGNVATEVTRTVNVVDTTIPVITLTGGSTIDIEFATEYVDAGATATDNVDDDTTITNAIVATSIVNTGALGAYSVTYGVSDSSGNAADEVVRTVNVVDTTSPVITLNGSSTVKTEAGVPYVDAGATATDNVDDDTTITNAIVATSTVNVSVIGDYEVRYNAVDSSRNASPEELIRTVLVRDTVAPVITLVGNSTVTTELGFSYVDAGATAEDSFEGSLTPTATSTVDTNTLGTYTVTYGISDSSGNQANEVVRTVNVRDTIAPDAPTVNSMPSVINIIGTLTFSGTAEPGSLVMLSQEEEGGPENILGTNTADISGNFSINAPLAENSVNILKFRAVDASNNNSSVTTLTITEDSISPGAPEATPATGTFNTAQGITLAISTDATAVRTFYTTDGTEPNESSFEYTGTPIAIDGAHGTSKTLHAISIDEAGNQSVTTEIYTFDKVGPVAPIADITSGFFNTTQNVTLTLAEDADTTFYTLDGTNPDATSIAYTPASQIAILGADGETVALRAISFDAVGNVSGIATETYSFDFTSPIITGVSDGDIKKTVTFFFNEGEATLDGNSMPSATTVNTEGVYVLIVIDNAGNETTVNFEIDRTAPSVPSITTPGQTVNADFIAIEGTAEAESTITITGGLATATGTATGGNFSVSVNLTQNAVNTLSVKATDIAGNVSSSSVIVIVEDSTAPATPVITTLPQTVNADSVTIEGTAEAGSTITITGGAATATGTATSGSFSVSVTLTQDATNTLAITATDAYGNVSSSSVIVIVEDSTAPASPTVTTLLQTVNADSITIEGTAEAESVITITGGLATATGTATGGSFSISVSLTEDTVNTLSVTATDAVDNESSAATILITEDSTAPSAPTITTSPQAINAASLLIVGTAEANASIEITGGAATATGGANGLGNYLISVLLTEDATNTLSITATDTAGNVSSSSVIVIVEDSTAPAAPIIITLPQTINAGSITVEGTAEANATINITGGTSPVTGTVDENSNFAIEVSLTQNATNNLSVTATDALENESLPAVIVIVEDSTPPAAPTITTAPQTVNAGSITAEGTAEADSTITITGGFATATGTATGGNFSISVNLTQNATNTLSVTATDAYGNVSLSASLVVVEDSTSPNAPNISTPNQTVNAATKTINGTAEAGSLITANGGAEIATSTATTGGSFSIVVKLRQNEANVLSLTATDAAGNESAADTVTITEDSIAPAAPTITTLPQTIDADSIVIEGTAEPEAYILIAIYGGAETVSDRAEIDGSFAIDIPLTQDALNHLLVTAADAVNNTSPTTSVDITEDGTPPVITLTGNNPEIVEVHSVYIDAGATALDSVAGDLTLSITASSNVNTAVLGEYAVTYNVSDTAGNLASSSRVVNVVDTTAPVITLIGSSTVTIEVGSAYVDAGATASDNYDLDITANITSSSDVNTALLGSYSVVFSVSDSSGNMASTTRIVEVVDTTSPVLTLTGANPQTIEGGNAYIELGATASDNYDNDISVSITVTTSSINTGVVGTYEAIYEVTDSSGNTTSTTRGVVVQDSTFPIITLNGSSTITDEAGTPYTDAGATATDNVDDDTTITNAIVATSTVNTSAIGDYAVTYGVSDSSGNPAVEITRIVQVRDTIAPVITLVGNSSVTAERGSLYVDAGATAEDSFEGPLVPAATGTVDTDTPGTYTIRYNVSDSSGNAASEVTREVIVADTTIPTIVLEGASPQIIEFGNGYIELGATANDTYDGDITANIVIDASAVNTNALGSYTVRYNVTDSSNNAANEVTRVVEVRDTTAPAGLSIDPVTTPINITPQTIAGTKEANSSVLLGGVEIVPADGLATWNYNLNLTEGTNGISLTLKDASGNESGVVLSGITLDTELPTITGVITNTSYSGSITPTFFDNLAVANATLNGAPFVSGTEVPDEGVYELIVTDTAGNTRTVTFTVDFTTPATPVVNPVTTPTNIVSQIIVGTKDADTSIWIDGAQVVALDPATAWSINVALLEGDNTFSITAKDAAGNVSSSSVIVIVRDTTGPAAPQANVPAGNYNNAISITLTLAPDAEETFFTVNGGEPTVTSTEYVGGTIGINGTNGETKTLKAVSFDALGNRGSTMSINYTFDTEGPAITLNGSSTVSIEQGRTYVDEGAIATDAADGNLTANITTSTTLNNLAIGTYTLTYSATDSAGNTGNAVRTIEVTGDVTAPELTMLGDNPFTLEQGVTYTDAGATATDLVGGNITDSIVITNPVNIDIPATYTITYAIEDTAGNSTSTTRTVIVNPDETPPVLTLTGSASVEAAGGNAYNDAGATANDNIDGIITGNIITTNPVNTDAGGTYIVRYNVADTRGNAAGEVTREVNVANDITAPVITINGENPTNIELKRVYFDAGASASDAVNGVVAVTAVSTVNTEIMNSYTVTYTARDASGNVATAIRTVNVTADVTPPVITIIGGKTINIIASSTYADAGATALDNVQGNVTTGIVSLNTVNAAVVGTYTISYNITDSAGNKAVEVIRTVHVVAEGGDATLPVITLIGSSTVEVAQGTAYTELGATASDNVDGDITANIITSSTVDTNVLGEYTVTYNVADTAGNAAEEVIRTVRVADITAPVIALIGNSSVNIKKLSTYTDVGATASDDTDGDVSARVTSTSTVDTATAGAYAVTYNVSDAAGNEATPAVRTVNVNELSTPVLANLTPTNTPLFILASSTVQMTVDLSDADDERISYNAEITSTDPDTSHWPALTKFTPFEPTVGLNNFNAIGAVKFTIQTKEFWNNATLTITARDRDGNEAAITRSVRTRP